ncbi:hypothetical protein A5482_015155 (plasmid) [Cyanobacterium sp. IPPAS B-1200]|uniref:hypothetical protein n=1 Tax=Cyanobacterium sp. IPPAS B-1200 TaxID=1562720 RepID=UPI0008527682|nr:hypothetical protein [Cyanobacterium sp. IPPAS B-1200]OEJ78444.1 hypothetical protein A5482_13155 [Cyanobacterium sp. IPPAS B-1200]
MLGLRFQAVASQLRVLAFNAPDLNAKYLLSVAQQYSPKRVTWAIYKRHDFSDVLVLWDVLNIDAVIELENQDGKLVRVGISLVESEQKGSERIYELKSRRWYGIRQGLKLEQYWVLVLKWKDFPKDKGEWIDILYHEIDTPVDHSGCRLIIL